MIDQILHKLGVKSIDDLKPAERATWLAWSSILSKRDVTIEDLKKILPVEIERAKAMLAKPTYSVTDIGMTVGFSETSSFTAAFRKATGMTPTAYHRTLG